MVRIMMKEDKSSKGDTGTSGSNVNFHPLQPPPEPPSKLYEDDDFDLYADIEPPPNPSKLAPPPEPPAALFALVGEDKDDVGGDASDEDNGLVIDDRHEAYDPEMPTSPPTPTPSESEEGHEKSDQVKQFEGLAIKKTTKDHSAVVVPRASPAKEPIEYDCPNRGMYSKASMKIVRGKNHSSDSEEEGPPVPPSADGTLDLSMKKYDDVDISDEQEVPDDLTMKGADSPEDTKVKEKPNQVDQSSPSSQRSEESDELCRTKEDEVKSSEPARDLEEASVSDHEAPPNDKGALENVDDPSDEEVGEDESRRKTEESPPPNVKSNTSLQVEGQSPQDDGVSLPMQSSESDRPMSENGSDISNKNEAFNSSVPSSNTLENGEVNAGPIKNSSENENDLLELGCEDEKDGLVDITDEEISNYERSWEIEDSNKHGKSEGLDGLETEAISDCEYPPADTEAPCDKKEGGNEEEEEEAPNDRMLDGSNKSEEGEIVTKDTPVQWKKLSKTSKERSYRGDKEVKTKEKNKEVVAKKKEKRKELERYDVRKLISEKPRRKVDEFGRDISSSSRSNSQSLDRGRRSSSRGRRRRSRSRSRSKDRVRSRDRGKERSRERTKSKDRNRKDRKSRSRSKKRRRSRTPRKERGRVREKSREKKKRKKSPSLSCSSCSCSSCEREKRRSKKLTVIVTNEEVVNKRNREKVKTKSKEKKNASPKRRRNSPVPSKEVFTSGDNILVSVNFKSSKTGEARSKDPGAGGKKRRDDDGRKKKDKGSKEGQPLRSIVTKKSNKKKLNTKNMKPVAIIDLDASPFRETILSPKEVIILTDSDNEDKTPQPENSAPLTMTGPKTPPEPLIKFNIVNNKQQQLRTMANPLLDSLMEQLEEEEEEDVDEEPNEIIHKGPNTPPEPPVPYDPFEPTKSRSPTPCPDAQSDRHLSPQQESNNQRLSPLQSQTPQTPPKLPQHVAPKTPSPLHSPPKIIEDPVDKPKMVPFIPAGMDSDNDSGGGGGGGGGDSPYSPGSSEGDDLFEPPLPQPGASTKSKARIPSQAVQNSKHASQQSKSSSKKRPNKNHKEPSKKAAAKKEIGIKLDEDQLKILDDLPNSAVEMQVKDKFLKKLNRQERVVEEVKMVLKPHYAKKHVTKEEYKEILRKAVPKICHSRSGEINPMKIQRLIEAYVKKYRHKSKKRGGGPLIPPLRQNVVTKSKTLWC